MSFSVFPSAKVSDFGVQPYNSVLSLNHLIEEVHQTFVWDNEALFRISAETKMEIPKLISIGMSGVTTPFRYRSEIFDQLNVDVRRMMANLLCVPRLHFLLTSVFPLANIESSSDLFIEELSATKNLLGDCDLHHGRSLSSSLIFGGDFNLRTLEHRIPSVINLSLKPARQLKRSATMISKMRHTLSMNSSVSHQNRDTLHSKFP